MSIAGNSIGIDYHTSSLQVCVMDSNGRPLGNKRLENDLSSVVSYVSRYGEVGAVAVEACTGSSEFADQLQSISGWSVSLCHPGYVRRMRANPDKSDKGDAELLSDLNRVGYLPEVWLAPKRLRDLKMLVRYRHQQMSRGREAKQRLRALLRQYRIKPPTEYGLWSKRGYDWLYRLKSLPEHSQWVFERLLHELGLSITELSMCHNRLEKFAKSDKLTQRLMKERGVGLITATILRAEVGDFSRFRTGKQLARFCGVTPRNASSGERQADSGLVRAGNKILKSSLIEIAHSLIRYERRWKIFAEKLRKAGKPTCVVVAAVANRWVRRLYYDISNKNLRAV